MRSVLFCKPHMAISFGTAGGWYDLADNIFLSVASLSPHKSAPSSSAAEVQSKTLRQLHAGSLHHWKVRQVKGSKMSKF